MPLNQISPDLAVDLSRYLTLSSALGSRATKLAAAEKAANVKIASAIPDVIGKLKAAKVMAEGQTKAATELLAKPEGALTVLARAAEKIAELRGELTKQASVKAASELGAPSGVDNGSESKEVAFAGGRRGVERESDRRLLAHLGIGG